MAVTFAGGADRISYAGLGTTLIGTLHLRFRTAQVLTNGTVLAARWDGGSRNGPALYIQPGSNQLVLEGYNATTAVASVGNGFAVNDGAWHTVTAIIHSGNGNTNGFYLDGAPFMTTATGIFGMQDWVILSWGTIGFWDGYVGDMADVAWWDNAELNARQAAALAKGYPPALMAPHALTFYAPFVRGNVERIEARSTSFLSGTTVSDHPRMLGSPI